MSDDILIRIGDGVTQEWTLSPSNTGLKGVTVDGVAAAYTQPVWNKVKLTVVPSPGAKVAFTFTGTVASSGGTGDGGSVTVDNSQVLSSVADVKTAVTGVNTAVGGVQTTVDAVKTTLGTVKTTVDAVNSAVATMGSAGTLPGEVKLFGLKNGAGVPAGWELDTYRAVTISGALVVAAGIDTPTPGAYTGMTYTQVGNRTYQASGSNSGSQARALYMSEPFTGVRTQVATLPNSYTGYGGRSAMLGQLNSKVIVLGGYSSTSSTGFPRVDEYDPVGNVFTQLANLPASISDFGVVALDSDRLLVVGGATAVSSGQVTSLYLYTRSTNTWQTLAAVLAEAVRFPRVARLPSGKVLIASGYNGTTNNTSYYVFDPATLSLSAPKPIGYTLTADLYYEGTALRTSNGAAFRMNQTSFIEYNETLDSFAPWLFTLASGHATVTATNYAFSGPDLKAADAGHVLITAMPPLVLMASQYTPTYRYLRKQ